jgi:hypothetical protein
VDTSRSTAVVKIYYAIALALHGGEPGDVGGGVYGMSEEGRKRFGLFPRVISDDAYARAHFASGDIHVIASARSTVHAPRQLADLIEIATRSRLGDLEMQAKHPSLWAAKGATKDSLVAKALKVHPRLWPLFPIYASLKILIRVRARLLYRTLETYRWGRDESSR